MNEMNSQNPQLDSDTEGLDPSLAKLDIALARREVRDAKQRRIIAAVASLFLIVIGALGYMYYLHLTDPRVRGIPPVESADGTTDYTIKAWDYYDRYTSQRRDFTWVLRFPGGAFVNDHRDEEASTVSISGGPTISFNAPRKNSGITFYVKPRDLSIAKNIPEVEGEFIRVFLANLIVTEPELPVLFGGISGPTCQRIGQYVEGVDEYVAIDETTYKRLQSEKPNEYIGRCAASPGSRLFALVDHQKAIVGSVGCSTVSLHCSGEFALPKSRIVYIQFRFENLDEIPRFRLDLSELLRKQTIFIDEPDRQQVEEGLGP
jgi:hypothetical protein